jgi:peptidyl-prolyl cis-trans isomerase SDCCAG10
MSQVYSTEPSPTGRVIFDTTHGPIDIKLFCKECPTTTRSFLQLCIDGYYDDMIFHHEKMGRSLWNFRLMDSPRWIF